MATKKQNRRWIVRRNRRVLNNTNEAVNSLGNMNRYHWGSGIRRRDITNKNYMDL